MVQKVQLQMGGFYLVVEIHQGGSATNSPNMPSYQTISFERTIIYLLKVMLHFCIYLESCFDIESTKIDNFRDSGIVV